VSDRTSVCAPTNPFCGEIYVMDADGRSLRRLTRMKRIGPADYPAWSPDRTEIAFSLLWVDDIALIKPDGSHLRRLTPKGFTPVGRPAWSPDGGKVAVSGFRRPDRSSRSLGIYTINSDGSHLHLLFRCRWMLDDLAWSPDGGQIAFTGEGGVR